MIFEGSYDAKGLKFAIVCSRFNELITSKLLGGAMDAIKRHGGIKEDIDIAWVPGSFEIPLIAKKMAESGKYDAVICLGAVIRGATGIPVLFGVLTTDTIEQAIERAGTKSGNKGFDCATAAIEMANLIKKL